MQALKVLYSCNHRKHYIAILILCLPSRLLPVTTARQSDGSLVAIAMVIFKHYLDAVPTISA